MIVLINAILNGFLNLVITLVGILLYPIDYAINSTFPSFTEVLTGFGNFLDQILLSIPWILSWFHIPQFLLAFICSYFIGKLTVSLVVHELKIALAWYRKIMP